MSEPKKQPPKILSDGFWPEYARRIRNEQWDLMERMAKYGILWVCLWNKRRLDEQEDELRCGLIDGMERWHFFSVQHPDWVSCGEWDDERYAFPASLTDAGRAALASREDYDMEPVYGGLVEPGWQAIPLPPVSSGAAK